MCTAHFPIPVLPLSIRVASKKSSTANAFTRMDKDETIDEAEVPTKGNPAIDNYSCGFVCTDLSGRNRNPKSLDLTMTPEEYLKIHCNKPYDKSNITLMSSLVDWPESV